jgi:hypothetical protein
MAIRDYRVYLMGPDGHIRKRFEFYCSGDEEARDRAKQYVDGHDVELWHRDQKITEFKSKP